MAFSLSCRMRITSALSVLTKMAERNLMSKVSLQACVVLSFVILSQLTLAESAGLQKRESEYIQLEVTTTVENQTTSTHNNTTSVGSSDNKSNTGAVVAVSVIAVVACITIILGVYIFKRKRQSRMMDKEKKMQIQMSSARNAGIYQDLTVSVPPTDDKPTASSPEHERLKAEEA